MYTIIRYKIIIKGLDVFITLELFKSSCIPGLLYTKENIQRILQLVSK